MDFGQTMHSYPYPQTGHIPVLLVFVLLLIACATAFWSFYDSLKMPDTTSCAATPPHTACPKVMAQQRQGPAMLLFS